MHRHFGIKHTEKPYINICIRFFLYELPSHIYIGGLCEIIKPKLISLYHLSELERRTFKKKTLEYKMKIHIF